MSKIVLVTGASRGIGRAIALKFAKPDHHVIVNYAGNKEKALSVKEEIESLGATSEVYQCNVSDMESVQEMFKHIKSEHTKIDVIVNNAGITRDTLLMRMKETDFNDVIDTNLKGVFNVIKSASRLVLKNPTAKIINVSSVVGVTGNPGQANYVASKAGVIGLTKTVAQEFGPKGITCNAVAPGFIVSDMTDELSDEIKEKILAQIPMKSFGDVEDIANAVEFLASDKARYINGQTLHVNGGMFMN
ncbi:3-oxoacyl-[acyl-carrier-protein] reductase [Abyssicoccus albus]|uniref:3-oxoacyl-[acyl-carrier-protein] reductase n=1 Tax=Abyssicoccus albus TaxID=1817405 RepID=A0A3N5C691_9BACL|nr:3-oxoacyl-[acyl-carrier-protein] reductase [Abyssicoccus albus]RPF57838.1 3-oxoacyl-[acyl-carrier-protein] reductase [Abyssicoccus albus]